MKRQITIIALLSLAAASVSCNEEPEAKPQVESIEVTPSSLEMEVGQEQSLTVTYHPEDAEDKTTVWSSSSETAVSVDQNGKVTALAPGEAVITARCGEASADCHVVVKETEIVVESIVLNKTEAEILVGETVSLEAEISPEEASDFPVVWKSSDPQVASVDDKGTVTGVAEGQAVITAEAGGKSAGCTVTVKEVPVTGIVLDPVEMEVEVGETFTIEATVEPENAGDKTVVWESDDESVATVDGGNVTAVAPGTAKIIARAGGVSAECAVTVKAVPVSSIVLDPVEKEIEAGQSFTITAEVQPENATDKTVVWTSSDESVATVADGVVTAVAAGNATITAASGDASATCEVTVTPKPGEEPVADIKQDWTVGELFDYEQYGKGIVFQVGDNFIKVVSFVENAYKSFSPYGVEPICTDTKLVDGKSVTDALVEAGTISQYQAADWARSKGEFWYIPTIVELTELYLQSSVVNPALSSNGSASLPYMVWSCIECASNVNKAYAFSNGYAIEFMRAQTCNVIAVMKLRFK